MKKIICILLALLTINITMIGVNAASRERADMIVENQMYNLELVTVSVNRVKTEIPAFMMNYRTYVPLRAICEALNCEVEWNPDNETATISNELTRVKIQRNNLQMAVRDRRQTGTSAIKYVTLDACPVYARKPGDYYDNIMVPARHVAEALRAKVGWNEQNYRVYITSEYDDMTNYSDGYAVVVKGGKYGFVDEQGQVVVKITYDNANLPGSNGIASVCQKNKWGFVRMDGSTVVNPKYSNVKNFKEGYAAVCLKNKWGFIDESGKVVISLTYEDANSFNGGLASVKLSGKYGFIDASGNVVAPFEYDDTQAFSEGYVAVCKNGKWGFIDGHGNVAIPFIYDAAGEFYNGKSLVKKDAENFYINADGYRVD